MSPTGPSTDVLAILEAAYARAADEDEWLRNVLAAAAPTLDRGWGVRAHRFFHMDDELKLRPSIVCRGSSVGAPDLSDPEEREWNAWTERTNQAWDNSSMRSLLRPFYPRAPMASTFTDLMQGGTDVLRGVGGEDGGTDALALLARNWAATLPPDVHDVVGVVGGNPSGHGCVLFAPTRRAPLTPAARSLWTHIAAHIAAGYRLVSRDAQAPAVDAVLDPNGRVQHLEPAAFAAREALTTATRAVDRARGKLRRTDPDRAVDLWKGLVAGRWALVDRFDHDGRRFVVAKRNAPDARPWHTLTKSETAILTYAAHGQAYKVIAYELGLSMATVARRLASAARKVNASSMFELVRAYRAAIGCEVAPEER